MHVVFITPGFAKDENDSTTIPPLLLYAKELIRQNIKVSVIAIDFPLDEEDYLIGEIKVYSCGGANKGWPLKFFTLLKAAILFGELHKQQPVDVIHSFWWQDTAMLGHILSRRFKLPHVITCMGQDVLPANNYARWFSAKGDCVVTLSEFQSRHFEKTFKRKPDAIMAWGIEPAEFAADEWQARDIDVIGVGWLNEVKNYDEFIEVIALVKQRVPGIKCVLAGDGKNRQMLEQKANALGLSANIKFAGLLPRAKVLQLMARSKVLLHTSRFEGAGYIFFEAITAGARIVSHQVGVADATNALIGRDAHELAAHINQVLKEEALPPEIPVYTIRQTAERYLELYQKIAQRLN